MGRRGPKPSKADAIARAALTLFVEHGVRGATTRAIARRAHTTEGNLYRYYASKQDLARGVLTGCLSEFGSHIAHALDGVAGPRERLRVFVQAYLDYARTHPLEHALIGQAHVHDLTGIADEVLRPRRILVDILSDGISAGEFAPHDPRMLAPFIAGGLTRANLVLRARGEDADHERVAQEIWEAVARLVGCRPPGDGARAGNGLPASPD